MVEVLHAWNDILLLLLLLLLLLKAFILRLISIDAKGHNSQNNTHLITVCYYKQSGTCVF